MYYKENNVGFRPKSVPSLCSYGIGPIAQIQKNFPGIGGQRDPPITLYLLYDLTNPNRITYSAIFKLSCLSLDD